jgi:hypothetical protein
MKFRHAAALALVGLYLMVPPVTHPWTSNIWHWFDSGVAITDKCNPDAPLSQWRQRYEFERRSECEADREKEPDETKKIWNSIDSAEGGTPSKAVRDMEAEEIRCAYHAQCVATDDPRLNGNLSMRLRHAAALALVGWYLSARAVGARPGSRGLALIPTAHNYPT